MKSDCERNIYERIILTITEFSKEDVIATSSGISGLPSGMDNAIGTFGRFDAPGQWDG